MSYVSQTKEAYQTDDAAEQYNDYLESKTNWMHYTMQRAASNISAMLRRCNLTAASKIVDVPCGTGILGPVLSKLPAEVYACDISEEMMTLAEGKYTNPNFKGFLQGDITDLPYSDNQFDVAVCIGFMHRVPEEVRSASLRELHRITSSFAIISFSADSPLQRLKRKLVALVYGAYKEAPRPTEMHETIAELTAAQFTIVEKRHTVFFLSSDVIFLVRK